MASSYHYQENGDAEAPPQYTERADVTGLPSYTEAASNSEPPPSYDSLYGRVKAAKQESDGNVNFFKAFFIIILSTVGFTILLGLFLAVPVSMIVMGALYIDDCPYEKMIPIYLIVAGCFGCAKNLFSLVQRCRMSKDEREEDQKKVNPLSSLVDCFLFAWFIMGCVYIYRSKGEFSDQKDADDYCNSTLYWYAFWITTSVYIMMGLGCCCVCFCGCLAACFAGSSN